MDQKNTAIWGLPYAEEVVGTIMAIDAFLGILLGVSTVSYKKVVDVQKNVPDDFK